MAVAQVLLIMCLAQLQALLKKSHLVCIYCQGAHVIHTDKVDLGVLCVNCGHEEICKALMTVVQNDIILQFHALRDFEMCTQDTRRRVFISLYL